MPPAFFSVKVKGNEGMHAMTNDVREVDANISTTTYSSRLRSGCRKKW